MRRDKLKWRWPLVATYLLMSSAAFAASDAPAAITNAASLTTSDQAPVAPITDFESAIINGTPYWEERYRNEDVHQSGFANNANANTLRTILGYKTGIYQNFQVDLGLLNVSQFGEHEYNDGSDRKTHYPTVGDPGTTQLFHGNVAYTGLPQTTLIGGRQEIALDNQRWVGAPSWRQIIQTFDGLTADNKSLNNFDFFYAHLFHQNRSPGDDVTNGTYDMDTDIFHVAFSGIPNVKLIGYSYLANVDNHVSVPGSVYGMSTATTGGRVEAKIPVGGGWQVTGNGEYARQVNYGNNPNNFGLNYFLVEPGAGFNNLAGKVGYEVLGSNGVEAVQSPMMAPHPMNGWADMFTIIPVNGLVDSYADVSYRFQLPYSGLDETKIEGMFHSFGADQIDQHYGDEYDLDFVQKIAKHYAVGAQFADYRADRLLVDTRKFILTLQLDY